MRFRWLALAALAVLGSSEVWAQDEVQTTWQTTSAPRKDIHFPDISGYQTLVADFHSHTVFSDGSVWPSVRIDEAWREGLDVLTISDHIEYLPHKDDVVVNFHRSYEIAAPSARARGILMPLAAEITKDTPPGHFNAIFLKDINSVSNENVLISVQEANEQGGFVFWNHQAWKGEEKGKWLDVHTAMYDNKWMHGMEVANGDSYYPNAHQWCLDRNLTMLGNSDIHAPSLLRESTPEDHRTVTLVFAREHSLEAVEEALRAGRTAVWFENQLIGRPEYLEPLFRESISIGRPYHTANHSYWFEIRNESEVSFDLKRTGGQGPGELTVPARSTLQLKVEVKGEAKTLETEYEVTNLLVAPNQGLPVKLTFELAEPEE